MKIIAGLGNPGLQYATTRHNCGFLTIDEIADILSVTVSKKELGSLTATAFSKGQKLLLVKPQSFMNLSGIPISRLAEYYKVEDAEILVIHDDLSLVPGIIRLRRGGRDGGHNGLKSIIDQLGSTDINRIKIGIGAAPYDTAAYVLSHFNEEDMSLFAQIFALSAEAALHWVEFGISAAMNKYNSTDLGKIEE